MFLKDSFLLYFSFPLSCQWEAIFQEVDKYHPLRGDRATEMKKLLFLNDIEVGGCLSELDNVILYSNVDNFVNGKKFTHMKSIDKIQ